MSLVYFPISFARGQLYMVILKNKWGLRYMNWSSVMNRAMIRTLLHVEHGFSMKNKLLQLAVAWSFSDYYTWPGIKHIM